MNIRKRIKRVPLLGKIALIFWSSLQMEKITRLLKKAEYYQPLYNFPDVLAGKPQRDCIDRADIIYSQLSKMGRGCHILDIGCSLGYFSYYFAERNYHVLGIDSNVRNIKICQKLRNFNKNKPLFKVENLSLPYVDQLETYQFDAAILLSVVHHIIHAYGLPYVQQLMKALLDKAPILFIELAVKQELVEFDWRMGLPENELDIFAACKNITIKKLGYFPNHLSQVWRPLYMVTKNTVIIGSEEYSIEKQFFSAYNLAPYLQRAYYDCGRYFIKRYRYTQPENKVQIRQELKSYKILSEANNLENIFPKLVKFQENGNHAEIVLTKLPGKNLYDLLVKGNALEISKFTIVMGLINALKNLRQMGLFHNDIRLWNVLVEKNQVCLFDFGMAAVKELDNTNLALLWLVAQLHSNIFIRMENPIKKMPEFDFETVEDSLKPLVKNLLETSNFDEILQIK